MEKYTAETEEFSEDETQPWILKQQENAAEAEARAIANEKVLYKEGDQVGNFLFVKYMKYKNRAVFQCPDCGKKFQYNIYTIKNKKRCKWVKGHKKGE